MFSHNDAHNFPLITTVITFFLVFQMPENSKERLNLIIAHFIL